MTVGEFIRHLQEALHDEGFTANNADLISIHMTQGYVEAEVEDSKGNGAILYIE